MRQVLLAIGLTAALASHASAQRAGQITGIVTDTTGAVVPGVTLTAIEVNTGLRRTAVSGEDGRYNFPNLRPTA